MAGAREAPVTSLQQAVELFKARFREQHPDSQFLIDGDGYEDEDLDLIVYANGDQVALEQFAAEVSHEVQAVTGIFILAFVHADVEAST